MAITYDAQLRCFHLCNDRISYIIRLAGGRYPLHVYWGRCVRRVSDGLLARFTPMYTDEDFSLHGTPLDVLPQECPVCGAGDLREGMLDVRLAGAVVALVVGGGVGSMVCRRLES